MCVYRKLLRKTKNGQNMLWYVGLDKQQQYSVWDGHNSKLAWFKTKKKNLKSITFNNYYGGLSFAFRLSFQYLKKHTCFHCTWLKRTWQHGSDSSFQWKSKQELYQNADYHSCQLTAQQASPTKRKQDSHFCSWEVMAKKEFCPEVQKILQLLQFLCCFRQHCLQWC